MHHLRYTTTAYEGTKHRLRGVYMYCEGPCPQQDGVTTVALSDDQYQGIREGLLDIAEKMWVWNSSTEALEQADNPEWPYPEEEE